MRSSAATLSRQGHASGGSASSATRWQGGRVDAADGGHLPDPRLRFACNPHLSGHGGGHDTNLRQDGRRWHPARRAVDGVEGERGTFAPDLAANLAFADGYFEPVPAHCRHIHRADRRSTPAGRRSRLVAFEPPEVTELDLARAGHLDGAVDERLCRRLGWLRLPVLDESACRARMRGVTEVPGLTFIGLLWQATWARPTWSGWRDAEASPRWQVGRHCVAGGSSSPGPTVVPTRAAATSRHVSGSKPLRASRA